MNELSMLLMSLTTLILLTSLLLITPIEGFDAVYFSDVSDDAHVGDVGVINDAVIEVID